MNPRKSVYEIMRLNESKNIFLLLVAIFIGILLGVSLIFFVKNKQKHYAVFLNNGAIYFGRLSIFPKLKLINPVFIQVDQNGQVSVQRFKDAMWMPEGTMYLNRDSILFVAPLDENSPLIGFIEQKQPLIRQPPVRQQPVQPQPQPQPQSQPQIQIPPKTTTTQP